jgi:hypothetical protein
MTPQNESLRITNNNDESRKILLLDPETASFSYLLDLVKNKVRSVEDTTIYMEYDHAYVYVDSDRLHEINRLPQQERVKAIKKTAVNISRSSRVLIYSKTATENI